MPSAGSRRYASDHSSAARTVSAALTYRRDRIVCALLVHCLCTACALGRLPPPAPRVAESDTCGGSLYHRTTQGCSAGERRRAAHLLRRWWGEVRRSQPTQEQSRRRRDPKRRQRAIRQVRSSTLRPLAAVPGRCAVAVCSGGVQCWFAVPVCSAGVQSYFAVPEYSRGWMAGAQECRLRGRSEPGCTAPTKLSGRPTQPPQTGLQGVAQAALQAGQVGPG